MESFQPTSIADTRRERRLRKEAARKQLRSAIFLGVCLIALVGIGAGLGAYCYRRLTDLADLPLTAALLRGLGFAFGSGLLAFVGVILFVVRISFNLVTLEERKSIIPVPRNPFRLASLAGMLGSLATCFFIDDATDLDWRAVVSAFVGALLAVGLGWAALRLIFAGPPPDDGELNRLTPQDKENPTR